MVRKLTMNAPTRLLPTVALTLSLFGCVTGEKMSRLHPGMTKAEVEAQRLQNRPSNVRQNPALT
jgi:hypothetical protein